MQNNRVPSFFSSFCSGYAPDVARFLHNLLAEH